MDTVKVLRTLGSGVFGTTYVVERGGKQFVCKIERLQGTTDPTTAQPLWREIEFSKFAECYPEHFMQLKSWSIMDDCKHIQILPDTTHVDMQNINKIANASPFCTQLTYTPVLDGTMSDFYAMKKPAVAKELYSMICQCIYAISLMMKHNYTHTDLHRGNIMYVDTSAKRIKLGNITVPTYGM